MGGKRKDEDMGGKRKDEDEEKQTVKIWNAVTQFTTHPSVFTSINRYSQMDLLQDKYLEAMYYPKIKGTKISVSNGTDGPL